MDLANLAGAGCVCLVVGAIAAFALSIVAGIARSSRRNRAFLDAALVARDLRPGAAAVAPFEPAPGQPHAVWLDLEVSGRGELGFDLELAVRVGASTVIDGTFPVTFDEEHDARGLPNAYGTSALNTSVRSGLGTERITTVLRAFRFDAPPEPVSAEVRARVVPREGVSLGRGRLLVTARDAP